MESSTNSIFTHNTTYAIDSVTDSTVSENFIKVLMSLIVVCGILGNTMSTWVLHAQLAQKSSFTLYLLARSLTDTGFLISLLIVQLNYVDIRWFHVEGVCQVTVFLSYVCSFLSAWFVTFAAVENYIRMCRPTKVVVYCTTNKARYVLVVTLCLSVVLYSFPLWTTHVDTFEGIDYCQPNPRFHNLLLVAVHSDTVCTFFLPLSVVLISTCAVSVSTYKTYKRRTRLKQCRTGGTKVNPQAKATQFLMGISLSFLVLHTPIHVFRIRIIILSLIGGSLESERFTKQDRHLKYYFEMVYYLNFSINFFIYLACGKTFRDILYSKFCHICADHDEIAGENV